MPKSITYIIDPFDTRFKLCKTKMYLDGEHDGPVFFSVFAHLRLYNAAQWRQIGTNETERRKIILTCSCSAIGHEKRERLTCMTLNPLWNYISSSVTPNFNLEH